MDRYDLLVAIFLKTMGEKKPTNEAEVQALLLKCNNIDYNTKHTYISQMYDSIVSYNTIDKNEYNYLVNTLCKYYIMNCPADNNRMLSILHKCNAITVPDLFLKFRQFGEILINNFITNLSMNNCLLVKNHNNYPLLLKYIDKIDVAFLNDYIRLMLRKLNSAFSAPETTFQFFNDVIYNDVKFDDDRLNRVVIFLKDYYAYVIRLIFCDVYEMLMVMNAGSPKVMRLKAYIQTAVENQDWELHTEFANEYMEIFSIFYHFDDIQRIKYRESIGEEQKKELRTIYPLYGLEASSLIKGK